MELSLTQNLIYSQGCSWTPGLPVPAFKCWDCKPIQQLLLSWLLLKPTSVSCLHRLSHSTCTGWNHSVQTKLPLLQSQTSETPRDVFMLSGWITWNPSSLQGLDFPGFYSNAVSIHWKVLSLFQVFGYWVEELQSTREVWDKRTCQRSPHRTVV